MLCLRFVLILCVLSQDVVGSTPSSWPEGTYALPKPLSGCPSSDGFKWQTGWIYQETGGFSNTRSAGLHLDAQVGHATVNRSFCVKTDSVKRERLQWPQGKYCIYKKGACPVGMKTGGFIKWDDEDFFNQNSRNGVLPGGDYSGTNTIIYFCCKTDGDKHEPISLPVHNPFFLLAYESSECQQVQWALAASEWIRYDTDTFPNNDDWGGSRPYGAGKNVHTIYYCHYRGCNRTLSGANGTFQSPNYPSKYPNGQLCSWKIEANRGHRVLLRFANFVLQKQNNTDSLRIFDGGNENSPVLGEYYGDHAPPREGLTSSFDVMFVIFKSDAVDAYAGFQASFESIVPLERTTLSGTRAPRPTFFSTLDGSTTRRTTQGFTSTMTQPRLIDRPSKSETSSITPAADNKGKRLLPVMLSVLVLCLVVIGLSLLGLFWRRKRQQKKSDTNIQASVEYESADRSSHIYMVVDAGTASSHGKLMESDNARCLSGDYEKVIINKCSQNVLYCSFDNDDKVIYNNLPDAQFADKESQNPLYDSTINLVSD